MKRKISSEEFCRGAVLGDAYARATLDLLAPFGFRPENTLAWTAYCRDEICRAQIRHITKVWGEVFDFSALAGMISAGTMAGRAAATHGPIEGGRERYIFFVGPHIAIPRSGPIGKIRRIGREGLSDACGALAAFLGDFHETTSPDLPLLDGDDLEYSRLKQRLVGEISPWAADDLLTLTDIASSIISRDAQALLEKVLSEREADYALFCGVQVHREEEELIAPRVGLVVSEGKLRHLQSNS